MESPKRNRRGWVVGVAATVIVLRIGWGASAEALLVAKGLEAGNPFWAIIIQRIFTVGGLAKLAYPAARVTNASNRQFA